MTRFKNPILIINRSGGAQPTLFAPVINKRLNVVTFENSPSNGDFPVTVVGTIDDIEVQSPITITSALSGAELIVTASANNFVSSTNSLILSYSDLPESIFQGIFRNISGYDYLAIGFRTLSNVTVLYKGGQFSAGSYFATSIVSVSNGIVNMSIPLILQATADGTASGYFEITQLWNEPNTVVAKSQAQPMGQVRLSGTIRIIDSNTNQEVWSHNYSDDVFPYNGNNGFSFTAVNGHLYYLVYEGTMN